MIVIVMGVAGSGKTTIGRALGWQFFDADDFHTDANKQKMARGMPLDDHDREGWLRTLRGLIAEQLGAGRSAIVACSALKRSYRKTLCVSAAEVKVVYLKGSYALLKQRLLQRKDHFFNPRLLSDQLATLEGTVGCHHGGNSAAASRDRGGFAGAPCEAS